jgi:hypothetical protein
MHFGHEQRTPLLEGAWTIYRELGMKRGTTLPNKALHLSLHGPQVNAKALPGKANMGMRR